MNRSFSDYALLLQRRLTFSPLLAALAALAPLLAVPASGPPSCASPARPRPRPAIGTRHTVWGRLACLLLLARPRQTHEPPRGRHQAPREAHDRRLRALRARACSRLPRPRRAGAVEGAAGAVGAAKGGRAAHGHAAHDAGVGAAVRRALGGGLLAGAGAGRGGAGHGDDSTSTADLPLGTMT